MLKDVGSNSSARVCSWGPGLNLSNSESCSWLLGSGSSSPSGSLKKSSVAAAVVVVVWPPIDSCGTSAREFWCCLFCEPTSHHPDDHFLKLDAIQYIYTKGRISEHCNQGFFFLFFGSASSWERSVGSLYHKSQKAQFEDPPHSKSLILSNY